MKLGNENIRIVPKGMDALPIENFIGFLKEYAGMKLVPVR